MKKLLLLILLLLSISIFSQKDIQTYYAKKETIKSTKVKNIIERKCYKPITKILTKEEYKEIRNKNKSAIATDFITKVVIPFTMNNISKLIYKPEKYIKNHSAEFKFLTKDKILSVNHLDNKIITYQNLCHIKDDIYSSNLELFFSFENPLNSGDFKILKFNSYKYKYGSIKLKRKHHKVNILITIDVSYFNENAEIVNYAIKPIEISNVIPFGEEAKTKPLKNVFRYIPTKNQIKSITITVNEVNTRKKVWDRWLKFYEDKKEDLQEKIIEKISGEEEE